MRCFFQRVISQLLPGQFKAKPDPGAVKLLGQAVEQEALFQLMIGQEKTKQAVQYMVCRGMKPDGVVLSSVDPYFTFLTGWKNKEFAFRFLMQTATDLLPMLHKFQGRITEVHSDKRTITVATPAQIKVLEHRRNVRLKLHRRHMPKLAVWGLPPKNKAGESVKQRLILDLTANPDETHLHLKNISAGGMRLSLPRHVAIHHGPWLALGSRLLVHLSFPVGDPLLERDYLFVSKISNAQGNEARTSLDIGVQFLARKVNDGQTRWRDVTAEGSDALCRLLRSYQLEYFRELKKSLIMREGLGAKKPGRPSA
jgi:hypothetical protein